MSYRKILLIAGAALLILFLSGVASARRCPRRSVRCAVPPQSYLSQVEDHIQVEEVLAWLPPDTETLIVANGPLTITDGAIGFERLAMGQLFAEASGLRPTDFHGHTVSLIVEGSRHFRRPCDIGWLPYQGCEVIVFEQRAATALAAVMQSLLDKAKQRMHLAGTEVACFQEQRQQDTWTLYFARPKPNVLLCATHEGYLKELLDRIGKKPAHRALPSDLPEWKHVDTRSQTWGIRHYSRAEAAEDPTSPFAGKAGANFPDPEAVGFTFSHNPSDKSPRLRYLTHARDALAVGGARWTMPNYRLTSKIHLVDSGVVEITADLDKDNVEGFSVFVLLLLTHLGHGCFL